MRIIIGLFVIVFCALGIGLICISLNKNLSVSWPNVCAAIWGFGLLISGLILALLLAILEELKKLTNI